MADAGKLEIPTVPKGCIHNAHMFYVKLHDLDERTAFIAFMKEHDINCVFHYIPLHSAPAGLKYGRFAGEDVFTTRESDRLVRLPMYYGLSMKDTDRVCKAAGEFFGK